MSLWQDFKESQWAPLIIIAGAIYAFVTIEVIAMVVLKG